MKIAIVTGASSGMGREFVRQLHGYCQVDEIWAVARRAANLEALKEETPIPVRSVVLDLLQKESFAAFAQLLDEYTTDLAEGLANIINLLGPAYVCLGGGVSHAGAQLLEPVREKTYARMLARDAARKPQIILARLHNDAGILGAALLDQ
jgi:predicted NBD/HSP70 family sugar kinase